MNDPETTHYYPVGRGVGYFAFGGLLLVVVVVIALAGSFVWMPLGGLAMALVAMWLGVQSLTNRKKYPMTLSDDQISFYVRKNQVHVPIDEVAAVFYNTTGIDKRASLRKRSGENIDIPVLYGLNDLVKKIGRRYGIPTSI